MALNFTLWAESLEMPAMPEMPSMPTISNPSLDGNFYKPSIPRQKTNSSKNDAENNQQNTAAAAASRA